MSAIYPLLIARKENAGLLKPLCRRLGVDSRNLISSKWRLSEFVRNLRNYSVQTHFVIDVSATVEKDDQFIEMLKGISLLRDDARIIIFADSERPGSELLNKLVRSGYTNIVASTLDDIEENWKQIMLDLDECFTEKGLSKERWSIYKVAPKPVVIEEPKKKGKAAKAEKISPVATPAPTQIVNVEYPSYGGIACTLNFYGAANRIGTTSAALITAAYFAACGTNVQFVMRSKKELGKLRIFYGIKQDGENLQLGKIKFTSSESFEDGITIRDKGTYKDKTEPDGYTVLVGGLDFNDIAQTYKTQEELYKSKNDYLLMFNFASTDQLLYTRKNNFSPAPEPLLVPMVSDKLIFPAGAAQRYNEIFEFLSLENEMEMVN